MSDQSPLARFTSNAPVIPRPPPFQLPIALRRKPPTHKGRNTDMDRREPKRTIRKQREVRRQVRQVQRPRQRQRHPLQEPIHGAECALRLHRHPALELVRRAGCRVRGGSIHGSRAARPTVQRAVSYDGVKSVQQRSGCCGG